VSYAYRLPRKYRYRLRYRKGTEIPKPVLVIGAAVLAMGAAGSAGAHHAASGRGKAAAATVVVYTSQGANEALGDQMAASYGWAGPQAACLDELWERESGWQSDIANAQSGAFGIAQALGHGGTGTAVVVPVVRYPGGSSAADVTVNEYPSAAANSGDAQAEIKWGLSYIDQTYGSPCGAWDHEEANSWY
jgi:hypothetical protein